jgi:hypothetical protein
VAIYLSKKHWIIIDHLDGFVNPVRSRTPVMIAASYAG